MANKWFQYATPESVGISSAAIEKLIDTMCAHAEDEETHGFTIIRHKKIVAEGFFAPFRDEPHVIQSCSKAFTAAAVGLAVQEGLLGLDDPVAKYLPEYLPENPFALHQVLNLTNDAVDKFLTLGKLFIDVIKQILIRLRL